jgi:SAM-dependent methyltransferase
VGSNLAKVVAMVSHAVGRGKDPRFQLEARDFTTELRPAGGGVEGFDTVEASLINEARLDHLDSLNLPLARRRVLDVGSGPGHLAQFFVERGCDVVSTDARAENIDRMRELYPTHAGYVADVEDFDFSQFGRFDVVFCYGLLYHLENPVRALRNVAAVCDDILLLETMIADSTAPILRLEDEYLSANQALRGIAHRPSPVWVAMALNRIGFGHVFVAREPPEHGDYRFEWRDDANTSRDGSLLRAIFVASRNALANDRLLPIVEAVE